MTVRKKALIFLIGLLCLNLCAGTDSSNPDSETAAIYVYSTELYINPSLTAMPTPTPTANPTPTPTANTALTQLAVQHQHQHQHLFVTLLLLGHHHLFQLR